MTFDGGDSVPMPITLDDAAKKKLVAAQKQKERLAEAEAYARMGSKVFRINARQEALLGKHVDDLGIKLIAKGRILGKGDEAGQVARDLGAYIQMLQETNSGVTIQDIVALQQIRRDYLRLSLDSADMLLEADALAGAGKSGSHIKIPYAAGSPLAVGIGVPVKETEPKMLK